MITVGGWGDISRRWPELPDPLDEALDDLEVDVGLEECHADLAERLDDIVLRQPPVPAQPVEDTGETTREVVKHTF